MAISNPADRYVTAIPVAEQLYAEYLDERQREEER